MSQIKDSGNRREFETGAVRDIQEGKGRYDLIPWEAIHELAIHCEQGAQKYGERNVDKGIPIHSFIQTSFKIPRLYRRRDGLSVARWSRYLETSDTIRTLTWLIMPM